jgi:predicted DNA-binding transcriptional regulator YafY
LPRGWSRARLRSGSRGGPGQRCRGRTLSCATRRCAGWPWPTCAAIRSAAARAAAARLAETDPEGALLYRLYRKLDVRPSSYWREDAPAAAGSDLSLLHDAIRDSRPVAFGYTDLSDNESVRTVLPLALVHPPQGVKLLAYCEERQGYRQFFVRAMRDVTVQAGDFADERMALLEGLVEKEGA